MDDKAYKRYEREIRAAVNKKSHELTALDLYVLSVIEKAKEYFGIYDETENKNTYDVFCEIFLTTKNRQKSMLECADDFGLCTRSLIRHKRKVLDIYICIYNRCLK